MSRMSQTAEMESGRFGDGDKGHGSDFEKLMDQPVAIAGDALESITRAEMESQSAAAHKYKRSIRQSLLEARTMATTSESVAASCFYKLPRGGKVLEGPSIRLAEIFACAFGNMHTLSRVVKVGEKFITAQGIAWDIEKNNRRVVEVERRITTAKGERFKDDMIGVTGNAACSIAVRNAIFSVIPRSYVEEVMLECKKVAIGDAGTFTTRRQALVDWIVGKMGIGLDRILSAVSRKHAEDIDEADFLTLRGFCTAIKDGEAKVDDCFPSPGIGESEIDKRLAKSKEERKAAEPKLDAPAPINQVDEALQAPPVEGATAPEPKQTNTPPAKISPSRLKEIIAAKGANENDVTTHVRKTFGKGKSMAVWSTIWNELSAEQQYSVLDLIDSEQVPPA